MMQRLKILGSALIALSFSASAVVAQQFDPASDVSSSTRIWIGFLRSSQSGESGYEYENIYQ